ncbi:MAG: glucose-6-phosphate isomerase [Bacteroidales bacterium]
MKNIQLDFSYIHTSEEGEQYKQNIEKAEKCLNILESRKGKGNDFLGWLDLPDIKNTNEYNQILSQATRLKNLSEVAVVIGIGGSYLGARAVMDALSHQFASFLNLKDRNFPTLLYAGNNISGSYLRELLELLDKKDYSLIVISKSGTTTEPAIAFRILKRHLEEKYGLDEAALRIAVVTDKAKGALKELAVEQDYPQFIVPDDVGGRYSVLSPVGLLPIAVGGVNIDELIRGAESMRELIFGEDTLAKDNPVLQYVALRNLFYQRGKKIEMMVNYEPSMAMFAEWWKQLFGESEGKEGKGIFPASVNFTTDLHSLGQYIQDGERIMFETVLSVEDDDEDLTIPKASNDLDQLNYLAGKTLGFVNKMAEKGTCMAHNKGGVENILIRIPEKSEYYLGQLIYFFEVACAVSGYFIDVNPFDQPGVEDYKRNMFALLGKKGFEDLAKELEK